MWSFGIGLDLLPELAHVDAQILCVGQLIPQFAEKELVSQHFTGMLHQHAQEIVFLRRQLHVLVSSLDNTSDQVDRKSADAKDRALSVHLQLMPQSCAHAGQKLIHSERLGHIIVGTKIKCLHLAGLVTATGQNHDRNALVTRADHPQRDLAMRQMTAGGTVVTFEVAGGKDGAFRVMNAFRLIAVSNNLGDSKSLVTHPATTTHMRIGEAERAKLGITDGVIRLSVGVEDPEDLKDDLARALAGSLRRGA